MNIVAVGIWIMLALFIAGLLYYIKTLNDLINQQNKRISKLEFENLLITDDLATARDKINDLRKEIEILELKSKSNTDLEKITEWAINNAVAKKSEPKKQTAPEAKKKSNSDSSYSSTSTSSSEPYNDYDTSRNLSDFSSSSSNYSSSSSDSYSGGGGDFGGGGSGGDW